MGVSGTDGPIYVDSEKRIRIVPNGRTVDEYDVFIGENGHIYLPRGVLEDLSNPNRSTDDVRRSLGTMTQEMSHHYVRDAGVTYEDLHIAFLKAALVMERSLTSHLIDEKNRAAGLID